MQVAPIAPGEFIQAAREYPIFLTKNAATGQFEFSVLLGLSLGENLFADGSGEWDARYVPAVIRREPFALRQAGGEGEPTLTVDIESPRLSSDEGDPLFLEHGGLSPLLEDMRSVLGEIYSGAEAARGLADLFLQHGLIEPLKVNLQLDSGEKISLDALYSVNSDKLNALDDSTLAQLARNGALSLAYCIIGSTGNVRALIERRNARDRAARPA